MIKLYAKYMALPLRKRLIYTSIFVLWHGFLLVIAIFSHKLQSHLGPLANKMERIPLAWLALSALIAIVSIPPLFGHELLAIIAGYVYGQKLGFAILTISSVVGESMVYFAFRFWLRSYLDSFRKKYRRNYSVFVQVVESGGLRMLWAIRMSVIPPHFSTPLFSSLQNITWWKWMLANILASPVKFYPPVFAGTLLRDKRNNSVIGDVAFIGSTLITVMVLLYIRHNFIKKKLEMATAANSAELVDTVPTQAILPIESDKGATGDSSNMEKQAVAFTTGARMGRMTEASDCPASPALTVPSGKVTMIGDRLQLAETTSIPARPSTPVKAKCAATCGIENHDNHDLVRSLSQGTLCVYDATYDPTVADYGNIVVDESDFDISRVDRQKTDSSGASCASPYKYAN